MAAAASSFRSYFSPFWFLLLLLIMLIVCDHFVTSVRCNVFHFLYFFHRARAAADAPRACSVWMHFFQCVFGVLPNLCAFDSIVFSCWTLCLHLFIFLNVNIYLWLSESRIRIDFYLCLCMKCSDLGSRFVFERTKSVQTSNCWQCPFGFPMAQRRETQNGMEQSEIVGNKGERDNGRCSVL